MLSYFQCILIKLIYQKWPHQAAIWLFDDLTLATMKVSQQLQTTVRTSPWDQIIRRREKRVGNMSYFLHCIV